MRSGLRHEGKEMKVMVTVANIQGRTCQAVFKLLSGHNMRDDVLSKPERWVLSDYTGQKIEIHRALVNYSKQCI